MKEFVIESVKKIQDAIEKNKLVIFVGAGASANSGLPSWNEINSHFAKAVGKKTDEDNYSHEDYLKIAQYYFNERDKKEYYDKILKILDKDLKPNDIHKMIFKLNPSHIITTNFDDLLEKAAYEYGEFFDVVCQDSDLPYTPNNKMIIKMHGDLKQKNIVYKEDDYLSYSQTFTLTETFVKSLFATHVVLFVGYSLRDPDVKLIFQWVKDVLKDDFQHAYLLDVDKVKDVDSVEYQYYRKKGINILYYPYIKQIIDENMSTPHFSEKDLSKKGIMLYQFLHVLKYFREGNETIIQNFYKKLLPLKQLKRILLENVIEILDINQSYRLHDKGFLTVDDPALDEFIKCAMELEKK